MSGTLTELWRYPVKSMQGERLERAELTPDGIAGDRAWAVLDAETGHVISGKRLEQLVTARATTGLRAPEIALPTGDTFPADDPNASERLSIWLAREVRLTSEPPDGRAVVDSEGGRTFQSRPGSFFDSAPLHLVTTASLAHLAALYPGGVIDRRRFRPNLVVDAAGDGPVEQDWVGRRIRIGRTALEVLKPCTRCIMTTSEQADLPKDRGILATVVRELDRALGVMVRTVGGEVAVGDEVVL